MPKVPAVQGNCHAEVTIDAAERVATASALTTPTPLKPLTCVDAFP